MVGLGGSGLAAIGEALAAGASVVGVDAGPVGGGAAGRNGGFLLAGTALFHHEAVERLGEEVASRIYAETLAELDRLGAELGPRVVRRCGVLRLPDGPEEAEDCARQLAALRASGFPAEAEGDGVLVPTDGALDPLARCRALAGRALDGGARLFADSPAVEITGTRVATPHGEVECGAVVLAVDGGLEAVLPELAGRVRSTRLQMLGTAPVAQLFARPVYHRSGFDYWQQLPDGRIVLGGLRDRHLGSEWGAPTEPTQEIQAELDTLLRELVGVADVRVTHRWAGVVAYTGDGLPVLEEVRPGVLACGAYSGHGNVLGSTCGRAAARIALGKPRPRLAELLRQA